MSNIVTFYSYKGGVGRTMAMANVAVLLALRGLKVLVVDWDLEAPGLERYFGYFNVELPKGGGLLPLLQQHRRGARSIYAPHLSKVAGKVGAEWFELALLPSGRDSYPGYLSTLEGFDWEGYFERGGGDFIEELRNRWRNDYDVTLIDSRTGLSDTGGICTIQLPDIVVALFTANYQSLYGVRDTMQLAMTARDALEFDRMRLRVLPVPTRFSQHADTGEANEWLGRIAEVLQPFYGDWLAAGASALQMTRDVRIPQVDSFGLGEKLAIVESDASARVMTAIYERIADLLTLPRAEAIDAAAFSHAISKKRKPAAAPTGGYAYDIFISHAASSVQVEWLDELVKALRDACSQRLGRPVTIFFDHSEVRTGASWSEAMQDALLRSRLLLAFVTPAFGESQWCRVQWATFEKREIDTHRTGLILPVAIRQSALLPEWILRRQILDISALPTAPSEIRRGSQTTVASVSGIAAQVAERIDKAPAFNPAWTVIGFDEALPPPSSLSTPALEPTDVPGGSLGTDAMVALIEKDPNPETLTQAHGLFYGLADTRDYAGVVKLGRALQGRWADIPGMSVMFAHSALETNAAPEALKVLRTLLRRTALPKSLVAEARVLSALAQKQIYLAKKGTPTGRTALKRAVAEFRRAYTARPDVAVAVDYLALRSTARRLKVTRGALSLDRKIARHHLRRLAKVPPSLRDRSFEASMAQLSLALGKWDDFERHLASFLRSPDLSADELRRMLTQLVGIWDLEQLDGRATPLIQTLRARVLSTSGGAVDITPALATSLIADREQPRPTLERVFGKTATASIQWWKTALERARSVGAVRDSAGNRVATCFLVDPRDFGMPLDEAVVMTAAHAVRSGTSLPSAVRGLAFEFEGEDVVHTTGAKLLWHSPDDQFDSVIVQLQSPPPRPSLPLAKKLPSLDESHRTYVVGHPDGRELTISFVDNELLDHDGSGDATGPTRVHYRAATAPGSSGSPVFNEHWELIAIHRSSRTDQPRLNGKPGTYEASEGIGVLSIAKAAKKDHEQKAR